MAEEVILLRVKLDEADSTKKAADLGLEIDRLKSKQQQLDLATDQGRQTYIKYQAQLKALQKEQGEHLRILTQNESAAHSNTNSYRQLENQLKTATIQLRNMSNAFERTEDGSIQLTQAYLQQRKEVENAQQAIIDFNAAILQSNPINRNAGESINSIRERIQQLQQVIDNSDIGSLQFQQAQAEAEELRGRIDDVTRAEQTLRGQYEKNLEAATALAGSISVLNSFIGDNEDAQEKLAKAAQAVAVTQAAANLAKSKGAIIEAAATVATKARTIAEKAYALAVGQSTGAVKALRVALASTGIGLVVFALVEAARAMGAFSDSTDEATEAQQRHQEQLEKTKEALEDMLEVQQRGRQNNINDLRREEELRKANGASEEELYDLRVERIQEELQLARTRFYTLEGYDKEQNETRQQILDLENDLKVLDAERTRDAIKNSQDRAKAAEDEARKLREIYYADLANQVALVEDDARRRLIAFDAAAQQELERAEEQGLNLTLVILRQQKERAAIVAEEQAKLDDMEINTYAITQGELLIAFKDRQDKRTEAMKQATDARIAEIQREAEEEKALEAQKLETAYNLLAIGEEVTALTAKNSSKANAIAKASALFQIGQDTGRAISGAIAAAQTAAPFPANLLAITTGILAVLKGLQQARQAIAQPAPKFAGGGAVEVGGKPHSDGGTKYYGDDGNVVELERGETWYVLNKRATPMVRMLDMLNRRTGGRSLLSAPVTFARDGGAIATSVRSQVEQGILQEDILTNAIRNIPPAEVSLVELERRMDSRNRAASIAG